MQLAAASAPLEAILAWRDLYRQEMNCQIIHDSIHARPGWSREYMLHVGETPVGYGSVAIGGPWKNEPAIYEFYVLPQFRSRLFDLFLAFVAAAQAQKIETQSNDPLLTNMLHAFAKNVASESILFHDRSPPLSPRRTPASAPPPSSISRTFPSPISLLMESSNTTTLPQAKAASSHYNRPYGDIYMEVGETFRRRGLGSFLVQELKRVCYVQGSIPSARCHPNNIASRATLQKAGFVPCGHILTATLPA